MKSQKGQAALEFLTTYGWAFLVILVMIGGLAYFGVFNFSDRLPDSCTLDNKLSCGQIFVITNSGTNTLQIQVQNNALSKATITEVQMIEKSIQQNSGDWTQACNWTGSQAINPDQTIDLQLNMDGIGSCGVTDNVGGKKTFLLKTTYTLQGSSIELVSRGKVTTTVNEG